MLTELKLSNFRIFDDEVTVRFRPITVLIGRNSSGKSSIIKFLLMLQQSAEFGRSQFLTPEGGRVSLGAFRALKNSLTKKRSLEFELTVRSHFEGTHRQLSTYLEEVGNVDLNGLAYKARATLAYGSRNITGRATYLLVNETSGEYHIRVDDRILADSTFLYTSLEDFRPRNSDPIESTPIRSAPFTGRFSLPASSRNVYMNRIDRMLANIRIAGRTALSVNFDSPPFSG